MKPDHELKTWPDPFEAIWRGEKTHEVRRADRPFKVSDALLLREMVPALGEQTIGYYTGRRILVEVTHITPGGTWGLPDDLCVMSIRVTSRCPS